MEKELGHRYLEQFFFWRRKAVWNLQGTSQYKFGDRGKHKMCNGISGWEKDGEDSNDYKR